MSFIDTYEQFKQSANKIHTVKDVRDHLKTLESLLDQDQLYISHGWELMNYIQYIASTQVDSKVADLLQECIDESGIVDSDAVLDIIRDEIEHGSGLMRLNYFLNDTDLSASVFQINGYGNLSNCDATALSCLAHDTATTLDIEYNLTGPSNKGTGKKGPDLSDERA